MYRIYDKNLTYFNENKNKVELVLKDVEADAILFRTSYTPKYGSISKYPPRPESRMITRNEFLSKKYYGKYIYGFVKEQYYSDKLAVNNIISNHNISKIYICEIVLGYHIQYIKLPYKYFFTNTFSDTKTLVKKMIKKNIYQVLKNRYNYRKYTIVLRKKEEEYRAKELILITDGITHAQDSGEVYARYLKNIGVKNYGYVIEKSSHDYQRLVDEGINVIEAYSEEHMYYSIFYKYLFTSYYNIKFYSFFPIHLHRQFMPMIKGKKIFLEHGITYNDHSKQGVHKNNHDVAVDYYVCGARKEYDELVKINNFNFILTGLPRHDNLHDNIRENKILIFFTWRKYLNHDKDDKEEYFNKLNEFLSSDALKKLSLNGNKKINLFMHFAYFENRSHIKAPNYINMLSFENCDLTYEIKSSDMLITDYSSVQFEFMYQDKPVLNYQVDRQKFFSEHYLPLINIDTLGLTVVSQNIKDFEKDVTKLVNSDFEISKEQREANDLFFGKREKINCQRLYELMLNDFVMTKKEFSEVMEEIYEELKINDNNLADKLYDFYTKDVEIKNVDTELLYKIQEIMPKYARNYVCYKKLV